MHENINLMCQYYAGMNSVVVPAVAVITVVLVVVFIIIFVVLLVIIR